MQSLRLGPRPKEKSVCCDVCRRHVHSFRHLWMYGNVPRTLVHVADGCGTCCKTINTLPWNSIGSTLMSLVQPPRPRCWLELNEFECVENLKRHCIYLYLVYPIVLQLLLLVFRKRAPGAPLTCLQSKMRPTRQQPPTESLLGSTHKVRTDLPKLHTQNSRLS